MQEKYKLVVFVPLTHTDIIRKTLGDAGAGIIGNYSHCSFSSAGQGRYIGNEKSNPHIGEARKYEIAQEERIETVVNGKDNLIKVIEEMKKVHPYDEVAYDVYKLENF